MEGFAGIVFWAEFPLIAIIASSQRDMLAIIAMRLELGIDMPCQFFVFNDGVSGFICGPKASKYPDKCSVPGCISGGRRLCDHMDDSGKICSAPLCEKHSHRVGKDTDLCPRHFSESQNNNPMQLPLEKAQKIAENIAAELTPFCSRIEIAGSIRRRRPFCGDIDLVIEVKNMESFSARLRQNTTPVSSGDQNIIVELKNGFQLDIFIAQKSSQDLLGKIPGNWGTLLLCRTGSRAHNIYIASLAAERGLHWNPYHGIYSGKTNLASETEEDIFRALGLGFIAPELREK
jgi:hypothetical protein